MKAIVMHEFGGPEVLHLEEVPKPVPAGDEVLIRVGASGVNPIDWKIRKGLRKGRATTLPLIPGWDVSGVVEQVGEFVQRLKIGDEVYSRPDPSRNGTYAEYVTVKESQVGKKPKTLDHVHAAGIPLAGLTAWQGLFDHGNLLTGERVLIHGAAGGVGSFAVQFAKWRGAYVIGTASSENISMVKSLGADQVIDYKKDHFEDLIKDIDLVFDTIGGDTQKRSFKVLKQGGRLITTLQPEPDETAKQKGLRVEGYTAQSYPLELEEIARLADERKISTIIAAVLPLKDAAKAQAMSEQGHTVGKIILEVSH